MKKLDTVAIIKEQRFSARIFNSLLFTVIGIFVSVLPIIYLKSFDANALIGLGVCVLCFGLPFGFFFGLKRLIPAFLQKKAITTGDFSIYVDTVKSTRMLSQGVKSEKSDYYCQIEFENYSKITGDYYTISRRLFDKTNNGDEFYLISIGNIEKTISIFPKKNYSLSNELSDKLISQ